MAQIKITKNKFISYLECQVVGSVNMNLYKIISEQTGLSVDEIKEIQDNYKKYIQQFPGLKEEIESGYLQELLNK